MFLQIFSVLILIALVAVFIELRKTKQSVSELKSEIEDVNISQEPAKCLWQYTTESWWDLELPEVRISTKIFKSWGTKPKASNIRNLRNRIEEIFKNLNIKVEEINDPFIGPSATLVSFRPAVGVKIQDILDLKNDISLALASHPIRIEAPIPGTNLIGIEIPNEGKAIVGLKEELETEEFKKEEGSLLVPFGRDIKYEQKIIDLFKLPHLLIGGATNSGKSMFMHSLIVSLMTQHSPNSVRFILADPKRVELPMYNGLPHLLTPVIMDYKKARNALKWCLNEMDRRFEILAENEAQNINAYNEKGGEKMPFIIFIVDEMADFSVMDERNRLREDMIKILQMGRAVGIHLIVGTSRPCDEIYPVMFRVNFAAKLAFSTASSDDSRIILDTSGAEKLLGRGDCLFVDAEMPKPVRLQLPFISDEDIAKAIKYIKDKVGVKHNVDAVASLFPDEDDMDELIEEAKEIVIEANKASASFLQRKLRIGYARAASILDTLEELGVIGPANGANPREVLVEKEVKDIS